MSMPATPSDEMLPAFVGGDWGTSHLRLFLCSATGRILDGINGPGAREALGHHGELLRSLSAAWAERAASLPTVLCGMVGSNFGWRVAPYLACPIDPEQIAAACVALSEERVYIVPGLTCSNRYRAPDFMRGEETQILGALSLEPALAHERHLLCLPGTHTKWVLLEDGEISEFLTAPIGELFAVIAQHSVLVSDGAAESGAAAGEWFENGLRAVAALPEVSILHRLFECRSRRLSGECNAQESAAYLSGLLIADDVRAALEAFAIASASATVYLIGSAQLTAPYRAALLAAGRASAVLSGTAAAVAGLAHLHGLLAERRSMNEQS
jgi:2-dehydro-3-deoxygalactonokinase